MNVSPSPSPRRLQRQRPGSPLAAQHRQTNSSSNSTNNNNSSSNNNSIGPNNKNSTNTTITTNTSSSAHTGLHSVSLLDGSAPPLASPRSYQLSRTPSPSHGHSRSYSQSYSQSYDLSYHSSSSSTSRLNPGKENDSDNNNYGYRSKYANDTSPSPALRPVQEYHSAFTREDDPPLSLPPPPSASGSSSPTSKFATFSSASRAFLQHRRQSSIPNLMPAISSIGRNLGRAISPDRSLLPFQPSKRPPIPEYRDETSSRRDLSSNDDDDDDDEDDDDESLSSDVSSSDEDEDEDEDEEEDEDDEKDSMDGSDNEEDFEHSRSRRPAPFTGDSRTSRRNTTLTQADDTKQPVASPAASGFTNWLAGAGVGTPKATSPERSSVLATSRTTTPEPSLFGARGRQGHTRRSMSLASNTSSTPRSPFMTPFNASPSRLSQLATSMSQTLSRLAQPQPLSPRSAGAGFEHDELFNLHVDAALFPVGRPSDRDAFSPAAYKNLEMNAAGALRRMQAAYRQRSVALKDMTAEKSVCDEELEEAETRAQHLKMQLEGMARRVADQQREMESLMEELAAEKKARAQERAMLLSGVPTVGSMNDMNEGTVGMPSRERDDDQATSVVALSEDLDVDKAQRDQKRRSAWRRRSSKSNGSSFDDTDDGDEGSAVDEAESSASVFSRSRSPTNAPSISVSLDNGAAGSDSYHQVHHPRVAALGSMRQHGRSPSVVSSSAATTSVSHSQPMTTFQKLMKNVTAAIKDEEPEWGNGMTSCRNCGGQDVSFAWNTVSVLRDENKHLKQRVGQLEVAVEGALDMVNGVGL